MEPNGPFSLLLNGVFWEAEVTERAELGSTEEWEVVNPTADTHPIHLHLVDFQVVNRQPIDVEAYASDWTELNADRTLVPPGGDGMAIPS